MPDATLIFLEETADESACFPSEPQVPEIDAAVRAELDSILASSFFKNSARCQHFLRHIVDHAEATSELKERMIGIAVFGRAVDYDTSIDAIVRVKAVDLRKRLTLYNEAADPQRSVMIELQTGSYIPKITHRARVRLAAEFTRPVPVAASNKEDPTVVSQQPRPNRPWRRWTIWLACSLALLLVAVVGASTYRRFTTPLSLAGRFLRPFTAFHQPIICISHHNAYNLSAQNVKHKGDAPEAFRLRDALIHEGRSSRLSVADDITENDLKNSPMIILGGPRHNRWTARLTQNLRFSFQVVAGIPRIADRENPSRYWEDSNPEDENPPDDFVIVTRLLGTQNAQPVLCIAGLKALGTAGGIRVALDDASLGQVLRYAPDNWDKENLQVVLHVHRRSDGNPYFDLVAATYW